MDRRLFGRAGLGIFGALLASATRAADAKMHRAVFQIDTEDRRAQRGALGNIHNFATHYRAKGETYAMEVVVFGPGFSMVRGDLSMMKGEVEDIQKEFGPTLKIVACHNTRKAVADSEGKKPNAILLLPGVTETPSGIVRLVELQEQGWAYIRP